MLPRRRAIFTFNLDHLPTLSRDISSQSRRPLQSSDMWVFGWAFDEQRAAKLAREWGFTSPESNDDNASQRILTRIYCLRNRYPAECVGVEIDGEYHSFIALCRDVKAKRKEDVKIPRKEIPPVKTCLQIQKLLGVPDDEAPQWYWCDDPEYDSSDPEAFNFDDLDDDETRTCASSVFHGC